MTWNAHSSCLKWMFYLMIFFSIFPSFILALNHFSTLFYFLQRIWILFSDWYTTFVFQLFYLSYSRKKSVSFTFSINNWISFSWRLESSYVQGWPYWKNWCFQHWKWNSFSLILPYFCAFFCQQWKRHKIQRDLQI